MFTTPFWWSIIAGYLSSAPHVTAICHLASSLDHLLARPRREEKSLTRDERVKICKLAEDRPLPPGWAFDGACYVDGFGRRSRLRPDATELCLEWLEGVNAGVDAWNRAIAQQ